MVRARRGQRGQRGVTYLVLLLAIAMVSAVLATNATLVSTAQRREREKQLLWAGDQLRQALLAYARAGDGRFPDRLEDLLEDPRSPAPRRFLRQLYPDPMTRDQSWGLLRNAEGRIVGVHSRSTAVPMKTSGFADAYQDFGAARSYADWKFAAVAPKIPESPGAVPAGRLPGPLQPASAAASASTPASVPVPASAAAQTPPPATEAPAPAAADEPEPTVEPAPDEPAPPEPVEPS
jgi:type II secretory pathway pseudopilin PulG